MEWKYRPTAKQAEAHRHPATIKLFGGAMGGGKSYWLTSEMIQRSMETSGNRVCIARKTRTSIVRTTLATFQRVCPPELIEDFNQTYLTYRFINGSELLFVGADVGRDPLLEDLKSLEVSTFGLEEITQMQRRVFSVAAERKDRWVTPNGVRPRGGILATCNPEIGWVKQLFYDRWLKGTLPEGWAFIPSLPGDNPHLSDQYLSDMKEVLSPEEQDRYLRGSWTAAEDPARLIPYELVKAGMEDAEPVPEDGAEWELLAQDVAYEGDDVSSLWWLRGIGNAVEAELVERVKGADEEEVAERLLRFAATRGGRCDLAVIDATGVGSGVATLVDKRRKRAGIRKVVRFKGGARPVFDGRKLEYRNLRDQSWWTLREMLRAGRLAIPTDDYRLAEDLTAPRYSVGLDRRVEVERKASIKKRLGRSTDDGDAIAMGLMARRMPQFKRPRVVVVR